MSTRETLEPIIQQVHVLLRADRIVRQPIDRRIMCTFVRLAPSNGIRPRPADTHLDDLGNDARNSETHEQPENRIMDVPSASVDGSSDDDHEGERDGERDDEK